jgi:predicted RNase H-like HicB family nuclease
MQFAIIIEEGPNSFGAYVPDLPGCIAAGDSKEEVLGLIREAIVFHLEGMRENGEPPPRIVSTVAMVDLAAD